MYHLQQSLEHQPQAGEEPTEPNVSSTAVVGASATALVAEDSTEPNVSSTERLSITHS